jgi:hypothetical protein
LEKSRITAITLSSDDVIRSDPTKTKPKLQGTISSN